MKERKCFYITERGDVYCFTVTPDGTYQYPQPEFVPPVTLIADGWTEVSTRVVANMGWPL